MWQGDIFVSGRVKDIIVRAGRNIYPAEIEAVLLAHPDVTQAAVIGRDDADRGQVVVAYVVSRLDEGSLEAWCRDNLAPYKVPQTFVAMDELPKRSSGKVDKKELEKL